MSEDHRPLHRIELEHEPTETLEALSREADQWGGRWHRSGLGGRLSLPVLAGLRRGWIEGEVTVEASGNGSRLTYRVEKSYYRVQTMSVIILTFAATGALLFLFAPFVPQLRPAMPMGILISVGAWLFIVAGLRNSGPEEFFAALEQEVVSEDVTTTAGE